MVLSRQYVVYAIKFYQPINRDIDAWQRSIGIFNLQSNEPFYASIRWLVAEQRQQNRGAVKKANVEQFSAVALGKRCKSSEVHRIEARQAPLILQLFAL